MKYARPAGLVMLAIVAVYLLQPSPVKTPQPPAPRTESPRPALKAAVAPPPPPRIQTVEAPKVYTAEAVLDPEAMGNSRNQALYELTQAGPAALAALRQIATTPLPRDPHRLEFEVSLRITAFEAIDNLAARGVDVGDTFSQALTIYKEPALQTLALVGLQGIEQGRPGKIGRFVDQLVE